MKISPLFLAKFGLIVSYLYILLFVYAAVSKLVDFENFKIQLGQSPLLSAYADVLCWSVPITELIIAFALLFTSYRFWALYFAFILMAMFSSYIFIILYYSSDVPCSCGGVLENLGWAEHLIFNLTFVAIAFAALYLDFSSHFFRNSALLKGNFAIRFDMLIFLSVTSLLSFSSMWLVYQSSDYIISKENPFIRRFPTRPVAYHKQLDLGYNSYYIAGYENGLLYLGNYTAPLHVLVVDTALLSKKEYKIDVNLSKYSIYSLKLIVSESRFYLFDGTVPLVVSGTVTDWKGKVRRQDQPYFSKVVLMDSLNLAFRGLSSSTHDNLLGTFSLNKASQLNLAPHLLEKQDVSDGLFNTDGHLTYSKSLSKMIYVYAYRNQFIVADPSGALAYRGFTIDTITKALLNIASINNGKDKTIAKPPLLVNGSALAYRHLLFINARLRGKFEDESVFRRVSTFDVYNLESQKYSMSFYIPSFKGIKLHSYWVTDAHFFVLVDQQLIIYDLKNNLLDDVNRGGTFDASSL